MVRKKTKTFLIVKLLSGAKHPLMYHLCPKLSNDTSQYPLRATPPVAACMLESPDAWHPRHWSKIRIRQAPRDSQDSEPQKSLQSSPRAFRHESSELPNRQDIEPDV